MTPRRHGRAGPAVDDRFGEKAVRNDGQKGWRVQRIANTPPTLSAMTIGAETLIVDLTHRSIARTRTDIGQIRPVRFPATDELDDTVDFGIGHISGFGTPWGHGGVAPSLVDDETQIVVAADG